jgi:thiamine biosynthesis lipoprotein
MRVDRRIVRLIGVVAAAAAAVLLIRAWTTRQTESDGGLKSGRGDTRIVMGTFANLTAVADDDETIRKSIEAAFAELVAADDMMSDYKADSELSRLNREAFERAVPVSAELFEVLQASMACNRLTDGAFDITVGPVVQLWRRMEKEGRRPTDEEIAEARARVGCEKLSLDAEAKTVRFAVPGMQLDLGAIAKGYGIDRAIAAMQAAGAAGGLVDVGGDIRCFGTSPKMTNVWRIGLDDPQGDGDILLVLNLTDCAIATSGDYRRFVTLDGTRYSHIINPATSASAGDLTSVTVIAPTAMQADALATAVSVMGRDKGLQMIESIVGVEAVVIPSGTPTEFIKTSGAQAYIRD